MSRSGTIGTSINLGIKFYVDGALFDPYQINDVKILNSSFSVLDEITPTRISLGYYQISYSIPSSFAPGTLYDQWLWTGASTMASTTQRYSFTVSAAPTPEPDIVTTTSCVTVPTWVHGCGISAAQDIGNGMGIKVTREEALASDYHDDIIYNIYYSTNRFGVFSNPPVNATTELDVVINVSPGKVYYFAVRATEFDSGTFDITGLEQVGIDLYQYPEVQDLLSPMDSYGSDIVVTSTEGYPDSGLIQVGYELMTYNSKNATTFFVEDIDRGESGTSIVSHIIGEDVQLWHGFEDGNTNIIQVTADWFYTNGTPRNIDAVGQVNVDDDGYRAANTDDLTTDLAASELSVEDFSAYDFNSYHRPSMQDALSGECVNSYLGGNFGGFRGFNFQDRLLGQQEMLLQTSGQPVIVLRRRWSGKRCQCISLNREHQKARCERCFSTGFDQGFYRLFNKRAISEQFTNDEGMFMIRVTPYTDDLEIVQDQGLRNISELTAWTLTIPNLKDRDIIITYSQEGLEEYRHEILSVVRNRLLFNQNGRQDIKMRRLDKSDEIYSFPTNAQEKFLIV